MLIISLDVVELPPRRLTLGEKGKRLTRYVASASVFFLFFFFWNIIKLQLEWARRGLH